MMQKQQESDHNSTGHFLHKKHSIRKIFTQEIPAANVAADCNQYRPVCVPYDEDLLIQITEY